MNIEKSRGESLNKEGEEGQETVADQSEAELSEDAQQTRQENEGRKLFIQDWVMPSDLTSDQKVFVAKYINTQPGAWRQYNGTDFKVVEARLAGNVWKVSFGLYFENYEAQRVDVEIPLSA